MPKGRGANARRRTPRQRGHLADEEREMELAERLHRGAMKLQDLYEPSTAKAEKRQKAARKKARQKAEQRDWL
jgi:hypothetical protein